MWGSDQTQKMLKSVTIKKMRITDPVRQGNRWAAHLKKEGTANAEIPLMGKALSQGDSKRSRVWRWPGPAHASMKTPSSRLAQESRLGTKSEPLECLVHLRTREMVPRYLSDVGNSIFLGVHLCTDPPSPAPRLHHRVGRWRGNLIVMRIWLGAGFLPSQYLLAFFLQGKKRQ